jgi:hypothetical protein
MVNPSEPDNAETVVALVVLVSLTVLILAAWKVLELVGIL